MYVLPHAQFGMLGTIVVNDVTALEHLELLANISFFPNPSTDMITIQLPSQLIGSSFSISDQAGKEFANGIITNRFYETSVASFAKGVYFLQINGVRKRIFKFVKN